MPKIRARALNEKKTPRWLETARTFYKETFGALTRRELRAAQNDWMDLSEDEHQFALCHLTYLDLMAHAGTQNILLQIRDALEEIAGNVSVLRESAEQGDQEGMEGEDEEGTEYTLPDQPPVGLTPPSVNVPAPTADNSDDEPDNLEDPFGEDDDQDEPDDSDPLDDDDDDADDDDDGGEE